MQCERDVGKREGVKEGGRVCGGREETTLRGGSITS